MIDRSQIDWKMTAERLRSELARRNQKTVWLAAQLAEKHGFAGSARSEIYALVGGKPFKLSDRKLQAVFDILETQPVLLTGSQEDDACEPRLVYCRDPHCRCAVWSLNGLNGWTSVPAPQWINSDLESRCRFCGEDELLQECPNCGHHLVEGSHCPKCGSAYTLIEDEDLEQLLEFSPSNEEEAKRAMIRRKVGAHFEDRPQPPPLTFRPKRA